MRSVILLLSLWLPAAPALALSGDLRAHCHLESRGIWARMEHHSGSELPLLGDPATADGLGVQVARAIESEFGVDARCVRVVALDHQELQRRSRSLEGRHAQFAVAGFQSPELGVDDTVFIDRDSIREDCEVLVHEVLHALSQRFALGCGRADASPVVEGVTEHFTRRVMRDQFRALSPGIHYPGFVAVADALARLVGERTLEGVYFHGGYEALQDAAETRRPGALRAATAALTDLRVGPALVALGDPRDREARMKLEVAQRCEFGDVAACARLGTF